MLKLVSGLSPEIYSPLCYVVASTDHTSADRIPKDDLRSGRCRVCTIPRSREVRNTIHPASSSTLTWNPLAIFWVTIQFPQGGSREYSHKQCCVGLCTLAMRQQQNLDSHVAKLPIHPPPTGTASSGIGISVGTSTSNPGPRPTRMNRKVPNLRGGAASPSTGTSRSIRYITRVFNFPTRSARSGVGSALHFLHCTCVGHDKKSRQLSCVYVCVCACRCLPYAGGAIVLYVGVHDHGRRPARRLLGDQDSSGPGPRQRPR